MSSQGLQFEMLSVILLYCLCKDSQLHPARAKTHNSSNIADYVCVCVFWVSSLCAKFGFILALHQANRSVEYYLKMHPDGFSETEQYIQSEKQMLGDRPRDLRYLFRSDVSV